MISKKTFFYSAALVGLALLGAGWTAARADLTYPRRPVRWVVPYAAGGATDVLSRLICQRLSERLGQPFVVENKPGAGSNIGTQTVINSAADGYTLAADQYRQCHQCIVRSVAALRLCKRHCAGCGHCPHTAGAGGQQRPSGPQRCGIHRLRQGQSRQAQHRLIRASAPRFIFPGNCSRRWPAFSSRTCPIADRRRA